MLLQGQPVRLLTVAEEMGKLKVSQVTGMSALVYRDHMINGSAAWIGPLQLLVYRLTADSTDLLSPEDYLFVFLICGPVWTVMVCSYHDSVPLLRFLRPD